MAGDWIKMREDLHEDEAVLWMAQQLGVRPETVVGMCHRFWGLVSRQTRDGCLRGPSLMSLGCVIGLPGFPELLVDAGWLEHDDTPGHKPVTRIPKFERHLSESSKKRALAKERKKKSRDKTRQNVTVNEDNCHAGDGQMSRTERDKSVTREEKRREEKKDPYPPLTPPFEKGGSLEVPVVAETTGTTGRRTRRPPKPTIEDICRAAVSGGSADSSQEPTHDPS